MGLLGLVQLGLLEICWGCLGLSGLLGVNGVACLELMVSYLFFLGCLGLFDLIGSVVVTLGVLGLLMFWFGCRHLLSLLVWLDSASLLYDGWVLDAPGHPPIWFRFQLTNSLVWHLKMLYESSRRDPG